MFFQFSYFHNAYLVTFWKQIQKPKHIPVPSFKNKNILRIVWNTIFKIFQNWWRTVAQKKFLSADNGVIKSLASTQRMIKVDHHATVCTGVNFTNMLWTDFVLKIQKHFLGVLLCQNTSTNLNDVWICNENVV